MKNIKCKIFSNTTEDVINSWIDTNPNIDIADVKYETISCNGYGQLHCYITYSPKKVTLIKSFSSICDFDDPLNKWLKANPDIEIISIRLEAPANMYKNTIFTYITYRTILI